MTGNLGVHVAAITPRGKQLDVDFGAAFELLDFWCAAGVRGVALFTAAGEYPAWTFEERSRLCYLAVKRSRVPVLAGVGGATLELSVALAREARDAGAASLLLPPPCFFRYQQDEIREFYLQFVAQAGAGGATFLYNMFPFTSGIAVETALGLLDTGQFAGIVETGDSPDAWGRLQSATDVPAFTLLSGNDAIFTRARCSGAHGALSGVACAVPELMVALDRAISGGQRETICQLDARLQEFVAWKERFPEPVILKVATGLRRLKTGSLPVPLPPEKLKLLDEFREWFTGWLPDVRKLSAHA